MTRIDWQRLAVLAGVLILGTLAVAAFRVAKIYLSLPMEAGGLLFGPFFGLPLLAIGVMLLAAAIRLAVKAWR